MADEPEEIGPEEIGIDPSPPPPEPQEKRRWGRRVAYAFVAVWVLVAAWNLFKPLPEGTRVRGEIVETPLSDVHFLADVTTADAFGAPVVRQQIFDAMFKLIGDAREYLVLDFFLFNAQRGSMLDTKSQRALSAELRDALLARKRAVPDLKVLVIADPVNDVYGGLPSRDLKALTGAGIDVVRVDLDRLRDPNPIYSGFWRLTMKWWSGDGSGDAFACPARRSRHCSRASWPSRARPAGDRRGRWRTRCPGSRRHPKMPRACRYSRRARSARRSSATSRSRVSVTASMSRCSIYRSAT
jgi:hypothetical protein